MLSVLSHGDSDTRKDIIKDIFQLDKEARKSKKKTNSKYKLCLGEDSA